MPATTESDVAEVEEPVAEAEAPADEAPTVPADPPPEVSPKRWYVVKVASGREDSIKKAIERQIKIDGLEHFFGQIVIPVEKIRIVKKVKDTKNGEKITKEKAYFKETKKFPGYLMAEVEFNADVLTLFRDVNGVGDFVGSSGPLKPPSPMSELDVQRMRFGMESNEKGSGKPTVVKLDFEKGDKVRIRDGAFANYEGEVKSITDPKDSGETPKVTVEVQVLGRPVPIEMEYFQVDKI